MSSVPEPPDPFAQVTPRELTPEQIRAFPAPSGAPMAPPWKREWRTTWKRWGLAAPLAVLMATLVGWFVASAAFANSPDDVSYYLGQFAGGAFWYGLAFGHWADHLMAPLGKWGAFGVTVGGSVLLSALGSFGIPWVSPLVYIATNVGICAIVFLLVSAAVKESFRPREA